MRHGALTAAACLLLSGNAAPVASEQKALKATKPRELKGKFLQITGKQIGADQEHLHLGCWWDRS